MSDLSRCSAISCVCTRRSLFLSLYPRPRPNQVSYLGLESQVYVYCLSVVGLLLCSVRVSDISGLGRVESTALHASGGVLLLAAVIRAHSAAPIGPLPYVRPLLKLQSAPSSVPVGVSGAPATRRCVLRPGRYVNTAGGYYFPSALRVIYCVCGRARSTTDIGLYGEPQSGRQLSLYL